MYRDELTNIWHNAIIEGTYKGERCDDWNKALPKGMNRIFIQKFIKRVLLILKLKSRN